MENRDLGDQVYLVSLLLMNGLAFVLICACYGRIYCAISGHNSAAAQSDTTVAKRMALLVFTDFACWAPIAFFGLTAVAGYPLIDVPHTKILLVFFYPLNSCANPYLYALLTKQYRRDLFTLFSRHGLCTRKAARYKGADVGFSSGNSVPPNCKVTSIGGSAVVGCTPVHTGEMNHIPQRSQVAPTPFGSTGRIAGPRGSPHPLRNSTTRLSLSCEQEMILRRAMDHSISDLRLVYSEPLAESHLWSWRNSLRFNTRFSIHSCLSVVWFWCHCRHQTRWVYCTLEHTFPYLSPHLPRNWHASGTYMQCAREFWKNQIAQHGCLWLK